MTRPNLLFVLADQLRAASLPVYGEKQIETPNIDRLAREGTTFTNAISTCPVCTPYRSMLLTGRHPQTTGHVINFVRTRHDEISIGDAFAHAGYRTAWIGKWHLHTGSFPQLAGPDFVPEGRDRLGFQHWRAYNFHADYFNGTVNLDGWRYERWEGYETDALNRYAFEFLDCLRNQPFCLFISPHQPHGTPRQWAPQKYYDRLPHELRLPANVPEELLDQTLKAYRNYLAMTLALDDMLGDLLNYLDRHGLANNTIVIFTSDHGTQMGAQGLRAFDKKMPYEESLRVPLIARWPGSFRAGSLCDALTTPVDIFPTLCSLCAVATPRSVEGRDLSAAWQGRPGAFEQDVALTMNFGRTYDYIQNGQEWRGVRTRDHSYARWLDGRVELFDLRNDPLEMRNLAGSEQCKQIQDALEENLQRLLRERNDALVSCETFADWFDAQRRIIRNAHGPLGDPEQEPDWSMLASNNDSGGALRS